MRKRSLIITGTIAVIVLIVLAIINLGGNQTIGKTENKTAYKVLLDGQTWFYVDNKTAFEGLLEDYKNQVNEGIDKTARNKKISFRQKIEISQVQNYGGKVCSLQEAKAKIHAKTSGAVQIEVKEGDTIWDIAEKNHVTVEQLQKLNTQLDGEMHIYPGDKLVIKAEKPVLDVVIVYEITASEEIPYQTEYISDANLYESQRQTVTAGVNGKQEVDYQITLENNLETGRKLLETRIITAPVNSKVKVGTKKAVSRSGSNFGVVNGSRISSLFGYRVHPITGEKIFHKGIDIAASQGSPVYAYANGTVIYAGWKSGYGNFIAIDHGGGMVTHYGHLSAIYVSVGQRVAVRQKIGAVGSTGVSTGPHLHFEVLINGEYKNPQNYL